MRCIIRRASISISLIAALVAAECGAFPYRVSINNISSLGEISVGVAFDFIDGGFPSNNILITNFSTDGVLGSDARAGGAVGSLPSGVRLEDSSFFNTYYVPVSFSNNMTFDFAATNNSPNPDSVPDTLSLVLLDEATGLPIFDTTDPMGASSIFTMQIDGSNAGLLNVYTRTGSDLAVNWTVIPLDDVGTIPEPTTFWLSIAGVAVIALSRKRIDGVKK